MFDIKTKNCYLLLMMIKDLMSEPVAIEPEVSATLAQTRRELDSVEAGVNVPFIFRTHYVNPTTGKHGARNLIVEILARNPAGMTTKQVHREIVKVNGFNRYPLKTVIQNLSVVLYRAGTVGKLQLSTDQDRGRQSKKTHVLYFLINK